MKRKRKISKLFLLRFFVLVYTLLVIKLMGAGATFYYKQTPIGASFVIVPLDKSNVKEVINFFKWTFEKGDKIAENFYYVSLPGNVKKLIYEYWERYNLKN